jgi:hypothetical protein
MWLTCCVRLQSERQIVGVRQQEMLEVISSFWKALSVSSFGTDFEIVTAVVYVLQAVAAAEKYRPELPHWTCLCLARGATLLVKISAITLNPKILHFYCVNNGQESKKKPLATCE